MLRHPPAYFTLCLPRRCFRDPRLCTGVGQALSMGKAPLPRSPLTPQPSAGMQEMVPVGTGTCHWALPRNARAGESSSRQTPLAAA